MTGPEDSPIRDWQRTAAPSACEPHGGGGARLDVDVDGSGDVSYYGDPAVTQRVDGSGDLTHAD